MEYFRIVQMFSDFIHFLPRGIQDLIAIHHGLFCFCFYFYFFNQT